MLIYGQLVRFVDFLIRFFWTIWYLYPIQIYGRFLFKLYKPRLNVEVVASTRNKKNNELLYWCEKPRNSITGEDEFEFFGIRKKVSEIGWNGGECSLLWRYNQHYFDDLNTVGFLYRHIWHQKILNSWLVSNPPTVGIGWDSYPTSLRIINWIKWSLAGGQLNENCVTSLAIQARWLMLRIEFHLLGNHLFANAKALIFAGLFFEGAESEKWLAKGYEILSEEIREQILEDGGHIERSPMYHSLILEDILDICNIANFFGSSLPNNFKNELEVWKKKVLPMLHWIRCMSHPDGEISFFNDSAIGIAPNKKHLVEYARRLKFIFNESEVNSDINVLQNSGYVRVCNSGAVTLIDIAPLGPNYQPGHAHADTLSFECSIFNRRIFVNGGTSRYEKGHIRDYERGTISHNTVQINGVDSSEVWSGFRVGRRAFPFGIEILQGENSLSVNASHNGYARLSGKPIHSRKWEFNASSILISDEIIGSHDVAYARFHLDPSLMISLVKENIWQILLEDSNQKIHFHILHGDVILCDSFYSPQFGQRISNKCLAIRLIDGSSKVNILWGGSD